MPQVVGRCQSVKDLIESLGVSHPEIDLILANGISVPFDYAVQSADRIAVYPRFTNVDIGTLTCVRPPPPDTVRFVVDVHLGTLARRLRVIGLDTAYRPDANDAQLADLADRERLDTGATGAGLELVVVLPGPGKERRVNWKGSHWKRLTHVIDAAREEADHGGASA